MGRGVHKDVKEAIRLYGEAAAGGHASAQYNLGYCYWYGEGVKTDKSRAIELFKQSADNGNAKAAQMPENTQSALIYEVRCLTGGWINGHHCQFF